jgi:hypothetical protein
MNENEISKILVDSAIEVHREWGGPGLLEGHQIQGQVRGKTLNAKKRGCKDAKTMTI